MALSCFARCHGTAVGVDPIGWLGAAALPGKSTVDVGGGLDVHAIQQSWTAEIEQSVLEDVLRCSSP